MPRCPLSPETNRPALLLKGGHVIDPANGIDRLADVRLSGGRIAAVGPDLPLAGGETVLDVAGYYVMPGIIDMHAHVFSTHRRSTLSLDPHVNTFSSGVTTVVDAGTAGWRDFADFRTEVIDRARIRVLAYVNIVGSGMGGEWEHDVREMRPELAAAMAEEHRDVVVGIKTAHYWAKRPFDAEHPPWAAVDAAVEAGERCGLPVMVDFCPVAAGAPLPRSDPGEAATRRHPHPRLRPAVPGHRRAGQGLRPPLAGARARRHLRPGPRRGQLLVPQRGPGDRSRASSRTRSAPTSTPATSTGR